MRACQIIVFSIFFSPMQAMSFLKVCKKIEECFNGASQTYLLHDSYSNQGSRVSQQDHTIKTTIKGIPFYGVLDGHGLTASAITDYDEESVKSLVVNNNNVDEGASLAVYCAKNLPKNIVKALSNVNKEIQGFSEATLLDSLQNAIYKTENKSKKFLMERWEKLKLSRSHSALPGTAFALAFAYNKRLYCLHVGDVKIMVMGNNKLLYESQDHKPGSISEQDRVNSLGHQLKIYKHLNNTVYRMSGPQQLAISRSFGDWDDKPFGVTSAATIRSFSLGMVKEFIIGSKGFFNYCASKNVYTMLFKHVYGKPSTAQSLIIEAAQAQQMIQNNNSQLISAQEALNAAHDNQTLLMVKVLKA